MNKDFKERERFEFHQACELYTKIERCMAHILDNGDRTFSIMSHSVCEWPCDYCNEEEHQNIRIHKTKENPYELVRKEELLRECNDFFLLVKKYKLLDLISSSVKTLNISENDSCTLSNNGHFLQSAAKERLKSSALDGEQI